MFTKVLSLKGVQFFLVLCSVLGVGLCMYTPNVLWLKQAVGFAPQIMMAYIGLGLLFLAANQPKLTFTSFACSAALCLFLKDASNEVLKYPAETNQPKVSIAHFNLINSESDYERAVQSMLLTNADMISLQEVTPDWHFSLNQSLSEQYPYSLSIPDFDMDGIAVYSKYPFNAIDTFHFEDKPNIIGSATKDGEVFFFVSSHTAPALTTQAYIEIASHLGRISEECNQIKGPLLTFGDYHVVPWSPEILEFRDNNELNDSRKCFTPTQPHGALTFFQTPPIDHIFHSDHFQCTNFSTLSGETSNHIGIIGVYEFVDPNFDALLDAKLRYRNARKTSFEL